MMVIGRNICHIREIYATGENEDEAIINIYRDKVNCSKEELEFRINSIIKNMSSERLIFLIQTINDWNTVPIEDIYTVKDMFDFPKNASISFNFMVYDDGIYTLEIKEQCYITLINSDFPVTHNIILKNKSKASEILNKIIKNIIIKNSKPLNRIKPISKYSASRGTLSGR